MRIGGSGSGRRGSLNNKEYDKYNSPTLLQADNGRETFAALMPDLFMGMSICKLMLFAAVETTR
jgi:hypothetical protein